MAQAADRDKLVRNSTNVVQISHFRDKVSNTYPTDAAGVFTLYDTLGNAVSGATGLSLTYVNQDVAPGPVYRGSIPHTVPLPLDVYKLVATLSQGGAQRLFTRWCDVVEEP